MGALASGGARSQRRWVSVDACTSKWHNAVATPSSATYRDFVSAAASLAVGILLPIRHGGVDGVDGENGMELCGASCRSARSPGAAGSRPLVSVASDPTCPMDSGVGSAVSLHHRHPV